MGAAQIREFGVTKKGETARLFTLKSDWIQCSVTDLGGSLVSLMVPDKNGVMTDVVLGYDDVRGYEEDGSSIGSNVGRYANRIGGAAFTLNGTTYTLDKNDGENNLHSGFNGYPKRMWTVESSDDTSIVFSLESPHMDQGFPGAVKLYIIYEVEGDTLKVTFKGTPEADTIINMTNHSYFQMNGQGNGNILGHSVKLHADHFTPSNSQLIPTGEIVDVKGTPMDFSESKTIGRDIEADFEPLKLAGGYDHNYCINNYDGSVRDAVEVVGNLSGICMTLATDYPGVQMYTGNFLNHVKGKDGNIYEKRDGVCFEPQFFPDSINKPQFASPVCKAGEEYCKRITYRFSCVD